MTGNARTFILMAFMTALLMGIGMLIGGRGGALLALVLRAAAISGLGGTATSPCCASTTRPR